MITAWLAACTLLWAGLIAGALRWGRGLGLARAEASGRARVCVPARDEEANVGACVGAVRRSVGVELEVVVADDASADLTAARAHEAGAEVRVVPPRPEGWAGKPWACVEAARGATAPWLVFVDADVVVDPQAIASVVARADADGADLVSLFGRWELVSFWERVAIPAIGWTIRGFADPDAVNRGDAAFANGQLLLVRRSAYEAWGGHGAVRGEVLDDVGLARAARRHGARLRLLFAPWAFRVRLYRGLGEIVAGYGKNLYAGMGRRPALALALAVGVLATSVLPIAAALFLPGAQAASAVGVYALSVAWRAIVERKDGRTGWIAPLHPLGALVLVAAVLASLRPTATWKGRTFTAGRPE